MRTPPFTLLLLLLAAAPAAAADLDELKQSIARSYRKTGRFDRAKAELKPLVDRQDAQATALLAAIRLEEGAAEEATGLYSRAFDLGEPTGAEALGRYYDGETGHREPDEALAYRWYMTAFMWGFRSAHVMLRVNALATKLPKAVVVRESALAKEKANAHKLEPPAGYAPPAKSKP